MNDEVAQDLVDSIHLLNDSIKHLSVSNSDYLTPCMWVLSALVRSLPSEAQKNLIDTLRSDIARLDSEEQPDDELRQSWLKALSIASSLVPGGTDDADRPDLRLIFGGKKDPA